MGFSTVTFLFYFLPFTLIAYGISCFTKNTKIKNIVLLVMSCCFYGWCGVQYLILLLAMIGINFIGMQLIQRGKNKIWSLTAIVIVNIAVLCVFKYFNFFVANIEKVFHMIGKSDFSFQAPLIPLPLGISFFVFQLISIMVDTYRGEVENVTLLDFSLYITFFPQLIEGPIVRYHEMEQEIKDRKFNYAQLEYGIRRFITGFAKKVLIADKLAVMVDTIFGLTAGGITIGYAWLGAVSYAFVIYYDFSGYSDMAIGLCEIFGFHISENFNYPYVSKSIQEFWRRWHISLSSWFRDYVYIPLGGNRGGTISTYRNLLIVFLLTGIWHGASWTFIIWGVFHGFFMLLERMGLKKALAKFPPFISYVYCAVVVLIGWVFFRADSIEQAFLYLKSMFTVSTSSYIQFKVLEQLNMEFVVVFMLAILFMTPVLKNVYTKYIKKRSTWLENFVYILTFVVAISVMMGSSFSPSIYTKF